ncbi:Pseudouridine-5'-phosphate glycosidase [Candidatus Terasakiella magnetica]|uniref:Pseudouridine-5'-phosphate glycosidase n=1 Tax=Candidatus Terasakiella magnetica TaxID=1867952 RepID=A0A1C3RHV0_9PROT|nr:pseudouridine-5'-phosphate glycosidase [Candidatus Terasakiella magnetica]SCA56782.1 Pseudouridine-5'-phosphate glycosidase [Candidatus Terasakiella magnetica]
MIKPTSRRITISQEVRNAFSQRQGVVALESTVITHGLPYPDNLATAQALEACVRDEGAVAATIAVLEGQIHVGLSAEQLEKLAKDEQALKLSRRDLPLAMSIQKNGGTTVATTMMIAHEADIRIFATGGIGGVHRGAESTFDISADLEELANTSVCVVCAGAKAVLDIPKTLEVLETKGVPTISYGCDEFPAFYYRNSGLSPSARLDKVSDIANLLIHKWNLARWPDALHFKGGVLIANPIKLEDEFAKEEVEGLISQALSEMSVTGRDVTPYLLAKLGELSEGQSKASNIALLKNNATLAAQIANELVKNC